MVSIAIQWMLSDKKEVICDAETLALFQFWVEFQCM